jgi:hypothetical protein
MLPWPSCPVRRCGPSSAPCPRTSRRTCGTSPPRPPWPPAPACTCCRSASLFCALPRRRTSPRPPARTRRRSWPPCTSPRSRRCCWRCRRRSPPRPPARTRRRSSRPRRSSRHSSVLSALPSSHSSPGLLEPVAAARVDARVEARVGVDVVAVVALLARLLDPVAADASAHVFEHSSSSTSLPSSHASPGPTNPSPHDAILRTTRHVSVLSALPSSHASPGPTNPSPHDAITQVLRHSVRVDVVAVVAVLARLLDPVAARRQRARVRALVAVDVVAVVARLARPDEPVAAARRSGTCRGTCPCCRRCRRRTPRRRRPIPSPQFGPGRRSCRSSSRPCRRHVASVSGMLVGGSVSSDAVWIVTAVSSFDSCRCRSRSPVPLTPSRSSPRSASIVGSIVVASRRVRRPPVSSRPSTTSSRRPHTPAHRPAPRPPTSSDMFFIAPSSSIRRGPGTDARHAPERRFRRTRSAWPPPCARPRGRPPRLLEPNVSRTTKFPAAISRPADAASPVKTTASPHGMSSHTATPAPLATRSAPGYLATPHWNGI